MKKKFTAVLAFLIAILSIWNINTVPVEAQGIPNEGAEFSGDGIYYAQDKTGKLAIYTSDGKLAESWAFCINENRGTPAYDPNKKDYHVGAYKFLGFDSWALYQEISKSRPRLPREETYRIIEALLYMFHDDPFDFKGTYGLSDFQYYTAVQDVVYYWTQSKSKTNFSHYGMDTTWEQLNKKAQAYKSGSLTEDEAKLLIPNNKKIEIKTYEATAGGVQSLVTARVFNKPRVYFSKQELTPELIAAGEQGVVDNINAKIGLAGAKFFLLDSNGDVIVNVGTNQPLEWTSNNELQGITLPEGEYTLVEKEAPDGYAVADPVRFKVTGRSDEEKQISLISEREEIGLLPDDKGVKDIIFLCNVKKQPNAERIVIRKVGFDGRTLLGGAEIEIRRDDADKTLVSTFTSNNTMGQTVDLIPGRYILTEKTAPKTYRLPVGEVKFTVAAGGAVTVDSTQNLSGLVTAKDNEVSVKNLQGPFIQTKASFDEHGIKTKVFKDSEQEDLPIIDKVEYNAEVPQGKYYLLAELIKNNDPTQVVAKGYAALTADGQNGGTVDVPITIPKEKLELGSNRYTVLEKLYAANDVAITDSGAVAGSTARPIAEHTAIDDKDQTVSVIVEKAVHFFAFLKVDENGQPLAGARLKIVDENKQDVPGMIWTSVADKEGDKNAIRVNLVAGKYSLQEVVTPEGCKKLDDAEFTVSADGKIDFGNNSLITVNEGLDGARVTVKNTKEPVNPPTPVDVKYLISKVEKGTNTLLSGAELKIYKGEGTSGDVVLEKTTDGTKIETALTDGIYTLAETKAPDGYVKANDIVFKVEGGTLFLKDRDGIFKESFDLEEAASDNYEAFEDRMDDSLSWTGTPYGKHYYLKKNDGTGDYKGEVLYCFNLNLHAPTESYDNGENIEYQPEGFGDGVIKYTKIVNPYTLVSYTHSPRVRDEADFYNKVEKVIYAGYPNNMKSFQGDLSDAEFKTATQLAVYYYTDSIELDTVGHGFEGVRTPEGAKVKAAFEKLIAYAESAEETPDDYKINLFASNNGKYQHLIGTKYNPENLYYTIKMEDEKGHPVTFSKTELNGTEELPGATLKVVKGENPDGTDVVEAWTSTEKQHVITLVAGIYTMVETQAPQGYEVAESITFTVTEDGKVQIANSDGTFSEKMDPLVQMKDQISGVTVKFSKVDIGGKEIPGAKIQIIDAQKAVVAEWISKEDKTEEITLTPGTYTFHEEAAPNGFEKVTDFTFTVDANGTVALGENENNDAVKIEGGKVVVTDQREEEDPGDEPGGNDPSDGTLRTTIQARNSKPDGTKPAKITAAEAQSEEGVQVYDTIDYSGLTAGKTYKVTARLLEIHNGALSETPVLMKEVFLKAEAESGQWIVDLGNTKALCPGRAYVVFEAAESLENLIDRDGDGIKDTPQRARHEDPTDASQTVTVTEEPEVPNTDVPVTPENEVDAELGTTVKANGEAAAADAPAKVSAEAAKAGVEVIDTISYKDLQGGKAYKVTGKLYRVVDGKAKGDALLTSEETFTADTSGTGEWSLTLGTTASLLPGASYVVFEKAVSVEAVLDVDDDGKPDKVQTAVHEKADDPAQTVTVEPETPEPFTPVDPTPESTDQNDTNLQLETTVTAKEKTAGADAAATLKQDEVEGGVTVADTVRYKSLVAGQQYVLKGILYEVENGKTVKELVVKEETVTAESTDGEWTLSFGLVKGLEAGKKYVVFERAVSVNKLVDSDGDKLYDAVQIASHEDPSDPAQTIVVKANENPDNPGGENPDNPGGENPNNPGGEDPNKPNGGTPGKTVQVRPGSNSGKKAPSTGDHHDLMLSTVAAVLSMGAIVLLQKKRRPNGN